MKNNMTFDETEKWIRKEFKVGLKKYMEKDNPTEDDLMHFLKAVGMSAFYKGKSAGIKELDDLFKGKPSAL